MKNKTLWQTLAAIFLALCAGFVTHPETSIAGVKLVSLYNLAGQLFLNALMLVVVPLVCSSIITGTARMGNGNSFKELGSRVFGSFVGCTLSCIIIGYLLVMAFQPGSSMEGNSVSALSAKALEIQLQAQQEGGFQKIEQLLYRLIPTNIIATASQGQMLGLIFFCMLFGFFINKIDQQPAAAITAFFQGIFQIMMKITQLIMKAMPFGVFALVAKVVATTGFDSIKALAAFMGVVLLGLALAVLVLFPLALKILGRVSALTHFKAMLPAILTAFTTSSSAAAMPVTIECLEKRAGVSEKISNFVIPLGTAVNLPGSALHVCVSVFFIAQVYGVTLSFTSQMITLLMILLTSFGISGIPSASLFATATVLGMVGLPLEGIGLIMAVERVIDMCRTSVNVFANSCCAVIVAKGEALPAEESELVTVSEKS